mgnify:CR=1 FL=1
MFLDLFATKNGFWPWLFDKDADFETAINVLYNAKYCLVLFALIMLYNI